MLRPVPFYSVNMYEQTCLLPAAHVILVDYTDE